MIDRCNSIIDDAEVEELIVEEGTIFDDLKKSLIDRPQLDWIDILQLEQELYSTVNRVSNILSDIGIRTIDGFTNRFGFKNSIIVEVLK